jgi:hypothetical protein
MTMDPRRAALSGRSHRPVHQDIYFIQAIEGGLIKIGLAADPKKRLAAMQAGCPIQLRVLGLIHGADLFAERRLHRLFTADRRHGEWFEPSSQLLTYIAEHADSEAARRAGPRAGAGPGRAGRRHPASRAGGLVNTHPAADLFPLMGEEELRQLAGDIEANGQREAIVMHERLILDGRNRWAACEGIGITPITRQFDPARDGISPTAYVLSANLHRRHLTAGQRAAIVQKLLPEFEAEARQRMAAAGRLGAPGRPAEKGSPKVDTLSRPPGRAGRAAALAAAVAGVSPSMVYTAKRLAREDPDLFKRVEGGEISVATAERQSKRRQSRAPRGGDTSKPSHGKPSRPPMSDADFDAQLAEAERQTRAAFAYEALEHLGRCRFTPADVAAAVPPTQRHRVNEYLKPSLDWLTEFHRIWAADDPA